MASLTLLIISATITMLAFVISSFPLYLSVKFLGGKTTLLKTVLIALISGVIISAIQFRFATFGTILSFIILIWIYHESFKLQWWKALLAWLLQFVFIAIFYLIAALIIGAVVGISFISIFL
jgi:hypothetical protein